MNTIVNLFPILGLLFIYRFALQSLGSTVAHMFAGVMELIIRTAVAFILPGMIGYAGVCLASPFAWIGATVWLMYSYFKVRLRLEKKLNELKLESVS